MARWDPEPEEEPEAAETGLPDRLRELVCEDWVDLDRIDDLDAMRYHNPGQPKPEARFVAVLVTARRKWTTARLGWAEEHGADWRTLPCSPGYRWRRSTRVE